MSRVSSAIVRLRDRIAQLEAEINDLEAMVELRDRRIGQLEQLNAVLGAEVDRQRRVVDVASKICQSPLVHASLLPLVQAIDDYEASQPK